MPRVRSAAVAGPTVLDGQQAYSAELAAAERGVGGLALSAGFPAEEPESLADVVADSFCCGQIYRAYGHDARVFDLSFHPAMPDLLLSASDDCTAGVWRRQPGSSPAGGRYMQVASFQGHADSVMRAAWSPDGGMVATGSSDGVVYLWQPTRAALSSRHNLGHAGTRQLACLQGHPEEVYACLFLQNSSSSSSSSSSSMASREHAGGTCSSSSGGGGGGGSSSVPQRLLTASGESLFLWDLPTRQLLQQAQPPPPPQQAEHQVPERWRPGYLFGVATQPDGPLVGAACSDGRLRLWAREGGDSAITPLCTLPWNQAMGSDCVFGRNGLFCAVSKDGSVIMMDVRQGSCMQHLRLEAPLLSCTLLDVPHAAGSGQCLVAAGADGAVYFVDVATGDVSTLVPEAAPDRALLCATLSADGTALAATGEAVVLGEHDMEGGGAQPAGAAPGHQPLRKWSPLHVWQRGGS